jgi:NAD(P)-dependent dehydrogenase (short-subunit alcohol dehydrogenase family)
VSAVVRGVPAVLLSGPAARLRQVARLLPGTRVPTPLTGRRVMVTGASSGIGEATARACAERGAEVLLVARRDDELRRVAVEITEAGGTAHCYPCDLTSGEAIDELVEVVLAEHGGVDYLVNNAGRSIRRSIASSYDRMHDYERTMELNYFGPVRLTMGLLPAMVDQGFGHVVNVLSWGVLVKAPKFSAYLASKSALDVFSRIAAREYLGDNITFTNVRMSLVRTDMIGATEIYRKAPALTPEQAALKIVRALEDRPTSVDPLPARAIDLLNLAAPRLADVLFHGVDLMFPESRAARRHLGG